MGGSVAGKYDAKVRIDATDFFRANNPQVPPHRFPKVLCRFSHRRDQAPPSYGIQFSGIHYWDKAISPIAGRSKQKYLVGYDPRTLSPGYVKDWIGGPYITVPYRDISHPRITQGEHRSVLILAAPTSFFWFASLH